MDLMAKAINKNGVVEWIVKTLVMILFTDKSDNKPTFSDNTKKLCEKEHN